VSQQGTQGFVAVPSGQLYYERSGQGPALVLIHSAFLDRREWDAQFASFSDHHTVVRYDVRGRGKSTGDRATASDSEDLLALLNHLDLPKAFLLGNSDGARIACEFAAGLPDRVPGLILVGGGPHDLDPTKEEEARFMDTFPDSEGRLLPLARAGRRDEALELILDIWAPQVTGADRAWLRGIASDNYAGFIDFMGQETPVGRRPSYPVADSLSKGQIPVLSIAGAHDNPALNMMMGRFAQRVPSARHYELADGDHTPSVSARAEFDRLLRDFLTRVETGQPWPPPHV
jgi:3-oxoadipate enol-lactonase